MWRFDDFDAWGEAVSGANLSLVCDTVETPAWTLGVLRLGDVVLQVASEGGGNLCYGANTHTGPTLFVPLTRASEHIANGTALDDDSLLAIPRGADFSIRVRRRAHAWCSIALPDDTFLADAPSGSMRLACPPGSVRTLTRLVQAVAAALVDQPDDTPAHRAAGLDLVDAARSCLSAARSPRRVAMGRPRLDRAGIIRRVMETIETAPTLPTAGELARRVAVNDRTLLRTFQETYGLHPKRYLMLRQLHRVRRALTAGAPASLTVADVLADHGIWDFGRFAGRYRGHFGELPSQTLSRARA